MTIGAMLVGSVYEQREDGAWLDRQYAGGPTRPARPQGARRFWEAGRVTTRGPPIRL